MCFDLRQVQIRLHLRIVAAKRGDDGSRKSRLEVLTSQIAISSTGREWVTVFVERRQVYFLDDDMMCSIQFILQALTPAAVETHLSYGDYGIALQMSVHLNEYSMLSSRKCWKAHPLIPYRYLLDKNNERSLCSLPPKAWRAHHI